MSGPSSHGWPERDIAALQRRWAAGHTIADIAAGLQVSTTTISRMVVQLGLPARQRKAEPIAWTRERVDELTELWADAGLSAAAIGRRLGCSRNAVIGKASRLGLPRRGVDNPANDAARAVRMAARRKAAAEARAAKAERKRVAGEKPNVGQWGRRRGEQPHFPGRKIGPDAEAVALPPEPDRPRVALLDLERQHCRWPLGDPGDADFGFCGAARAPGKPYCPYHAGIATSQTVSSGQKGYFQLGATRRRADAAHKEGYVA